MAEELLGVHLDAQEEVVEVGEDLVVVPAAVHQAALRQKTLLPEANLAEDGTD